MAYRCVAVHHGSNLFEDGLAFWCVLVDAFYRDLSAQSYFRIVFTCVFRSSVCLVLKRFYNSSSKTSCGFFCSEDLYQTGLKI